MDLVVTASGMVTPVGFNAASSLSAMRAGIRSVREANIWDKETGTYLSAGKVDLPHWSNRLEKLADLAAPAISECLAEAENTATEEIPLLLGVASQDRRNRWKHLDEQIIGEIEHRLQTQFHPSSKTIPRDRVSGIASLQEAYQLIEELKVPYCILAATDSYLCPKMLRPYIEKRRLLTPRNSNGFSPGEAGTAVLVRKPRVQTEPGVLHILSTSLTQEKATIESTDPLNGEGLTKACKEVFSEGKLTVYDIDYRITDLNGEHYRFKEACIADLRFVRDPKEKLYDLWHPIEYLGDIGSAIGPCALAVALHASQKGYAVGTTALLHFGNDNGERAAAIVKYIK